MAIVKTIYVPTATTPEMREVLMSIHKRATEIVPYDDQVESGNPQTILDFFMSRREPDCFIYVDDPQFVQALIVERLTHGTIVVDDEGTYHTIHYEYNPGVEPRRQLKRMSGMYKPKNLPMQGGLNYIH